MGTGMTLEYIRNVSAMFHAMTNKPETPPIKRGGFMQIVSIAVSKKKGTPKKCVNQAILIENHGIKNDAHAGDWHRQISFLASKSIRRAATQNFSPGFGGFAENIATSGIDWRAVSLGQKICLGNEALVEITQIGKKCHKKCAVFYRTGTCIMPKEGIFAKVLKGGFINVGDRISYL